jgi:hypothetical protein
MRDKPQEGQRPFSSELNFSGRFFFHDEKTKPFHVRISYGSDTPTQILGSVLGRSTQAIDLIRLESGRHARLQSVPRKRYPGLDTSYYRIYSDDFSVLSSSTGRINSSLNITQVIDALAEIRFYTLHVDYFSDYKNAMPERTLDFYLAGPRGCWNLFAIREVHSDGTTNFFCGKKTQRTIQIDPKLGIKCGIKQVFNYERGLPSQQLVSTVCAISFSTKRDIKGLSDKLFTSVCTEIAERVLLLASFVSESRISWFRRVLYTQSGIRETVRDLWIRDDQHSCVDRNFAPVDARHFYNFMKKSLLAFDSRVAEDMRILIELYIAGSSAQFSEEQFITLYRAIEKFVAVHIDRSETNIMDRKG